MTKLHVRYCIFLRNSFEKSRTFEKNKTLKRMPSKVTLNSFLQVFDEKFARGGDWFPHLFLEKFCEEFCCILCNKYEKCGEYENSYKYDNSYEYDNSPKNLRYVSDCMHFDCWSNNPRIKKIAKVNQQGCEYDNTFRSRNYSPKIYNYALRKILFKHS